MSQQTINVGAAPNDGTGTPLRTAFQYTNSNFSELYTALGGGSGLPGATTQVIFNDGGTNLAGDAGLVYNKTTDALTIGGNVQAASATITGDLTVDTSTLKVDSTNNRVGIGTASPAFPLDIDSTLGTVVNINSTNANGPGLRWTRSGTVNGYVGSAKYTVGGALADFSIDASGANNLIFGTNDVERARIDSSGNLGLGVTPSAGGGVLQLKSGITFPATQVASSDANTLDDYEEGTFTPTIIGTTTAGTATYSVQQGVYTKVGRNVSYQIYVAWSGGTGTGNLRLTGLPFTANSTYLSPVSIYAINVALTAGSSAAGLVANNSTYIDLAQLPTGGGTDASIPYDAAGSILVSGSYIV